MNVEIHQKAMVTVDTIPFETIPGFDEEYDDDELTDTEVIEVPDPEPGCIFDQAG